RESACRILMETLARAGEHAEAVRVYRDFRVQLYRELLIEPAPSTKILYEQIRLDANTCYPRTVPGSDDSSSSSTNTSIPRPLTRLIGRERELEHIYSSFQDFRLVTLKGPGGV